MLPPMSSSIQLGRHQINSQIDRLEYLERLLNIAIIPLVYPCGSRRRRLCFIGYAFSCFLAAVAHLIVLHYSRAYRKERLATCVIPY